jgi:hypothetical protein
LFYPFLSLRQTAWQPKVTTVKPHQCPLHQFVLLTQGSIPEIFTKNTENWRSWKSQFFWVGYFEFKKKKILLLPNIDQSQFMWYQGWKEIFEITLSSSKKLRMCNNMRNTVCSTQPFWIITVLLKWVTKKSLLLPTSLK